MTPTMASPFTSNSGQSPSSRGTRAARALQSRKYRLGVSHSRLRGGESEPSHTRTKTSGSPSRRTSASAASGVSITIPQRLPFTLLHDQLHGLEPLRVLLVVPIAHTPVGQHA